MRTHLFIAQEKHLSVVGKVCLLHLKGRVQWFSMQVVINKCFVLNPVKNLA